MPTSLYGPNDNFNLETAHVPPTLIRKFDLAKLLRENKYEKVAADLKAYPLGFGLDSSIDTAKKESVVRRCEYWEPRPRRLPFGTQANLMVNSFMSMIYQTLFSF